MATFTANVQGTYIVPIPLSANLTNITLNGALDGQQVVLEFQQNGTGGWTVASSTITGLQQPVATASTNSFQLFIYNSGLSEWQAFGGGGGGGAGVSSLNSLTGALTAAAGSGITITPSGGNTLTFAATGGGGGVSSVNGLTGAVTAAAGSGITLNTIGGTLNIINSSSPASLPWYDVQAYGGQPRTFSISAETTTATSSSGSPNITLAAAKNFVNGQYVVLWKAGNATTQSTPTIPSAVANCVQGSLSLSYQCVGVDALGGLTAASPVATITNAPNIFGNLPVAISTITASAGTVAVTFAAPINAVPGQTVHIIKVTGSGATWNGVWTVLTAPTSSSITYLVSGATGSGTVSASSTGRLSNVAIITAISRSATGVITITTAQPHNFVATPGTKNAAVVIIENVTPFDLNGQYVMATASGTTITCNSGQWLAESGTVTAGLSIATSYEYVYVTCPAYSGTTVAYYIYSNSPNPLSTLTLIGKTMPGEKGWKDGGPNLMQGFVAPAYVPASPPVSPQGQMFGASVLSGGGTTSLVLSASVPTSVTSQTLLHDDGQAIAAACVAIHASSDQFGTVFMSPPQGTAPFLPEYIINYPVTIPTNDSIIFGSQTVINETITMAGGNAMWMSPLGYLGSIDIQFGVGPYMPLTGIGNPMVYVSGDSTNFQNILFSCGGGTTNNPNQQNGQYGIIVQAGKAKFRDCFFASGVSSTAIPCILNSPTGGTVNISFDTCQWSGSSVYGNVSTVVGQSALLPAWCCNLWIHGSDNAGGIGASSQISITGNCSFEGRGILIDALNYSNSSEQNYIFGVGGAIEYQAPCTPSLMLWGQFFVNVVMANWINDTEQGGIVANWTNTLVNNVIIENCTTSGNASLATGNAFATITFKGNLAATATSDSVLGQNINRVSLTVGKVLTTTGTTSDVLTVNGAFQGSVPQISGGNASASADIAAGNVSVSVTAANQITVLHGSTSGMIFNVSATGGF